VRKKRLFAQLSSSVSFPRSRSDRIGLPVSFAAFCAAFRSVYQY